MNAKRMIGISLGAAALAASSLMIASPSEAASCWTTHTSTSASGQCSGYSSTGTFRVVATFCSYADGCTTRYGNWAFLQGGTSKVYAPSGMHWSSDWINYGPAGG